MTITLQNGLKITIPNHQLISPFRHIDRSGVQIVSSPGKKKVILFMAEQLTTPLLGIPFLSSAYLTIKHEMKEYGLAVSKHPRSPTADIFPILATACEEKESTSSDSIANPSNSSRANVAGITGGVIGGIGAVVLLFVAVGFWRRKRSRSYQGGKPDTEPPVYTGIAEADSQTQQDVNYHMHEIGGRSRAKLQGNISGVELE